MPPRRHSWSALRRSRAVIVAVVLSAGVAACGDVVGPPTSLTGDWTSAPTGGTAVTSGAVQLALVQQGDQLAGTGTINGTNGAIGLTVSGFIQGTVVMLSLAGDEGAPFTSPLQYSAVLLDSRRQMEGTLTYQTISESRTFVR